MLKLLFNLKERKKNIICLKKMRICFLLYEYSFFFFNNLFRTQSVNRRSGISISELGTLFFNNFFM